MDIESFVISMDSETGKSRREKFYKECEYADIPNPTWVKGIAFTPETIRKHRDLLSNLCASTCSPGAIGCGLAHLSIFQMRRSSDEPILVFEDDCVLSNGFRDKIDAALKVVPDTFDVLFLGCQSSCGDPGRPAGVHPVQDTHGAHAYVISAKGRDKMLKIGLLDHIDIQIGAMAKKGLMNVYYCWPDIASASTVEMQNSMNSPPTGFPNSMTTVMNAIYNEKGLPISRHYTGQVRRLGPISLTNWHFILFLTGVIAGFRGVIWMLFALDVALFPGDAWNTTTTIGAYVLGSAINRMLLT